MPNVRSFLYVAVKISKFVLNNEIHLSENPGFVEYIERETILCVSRKKFDVISLEFGNAYKYFPEWQWLDIWFVMICVISQLLFILVTEMIMRNLKDDISN